MNRNYIVLAVIAIGLAIGILLMDNTEQRREKDPAALAVSYNEPSRFLSIDEVTDRMINEDPAIILIDVRPAEQFNQFSIPGAINIPVDSILTSTSLDLFRIKGLDKVLYSNSDVWSDQAWLLLERLEMPTVFVLEGGVNHWFNSIVQAQEPAVSAPTEQHDLYSFRKAAFQHYYGAPVEASVTDKALTAAPKTKAPKSVPVTRQEPAVESGGGC